VNRRTGLRHGNLLLGMDYPPSPRHRPSSAPLAVLEWLLPVVLGRPLEAERLTTIEDLRALPARPGGTHLRAA
jgi:hypothetical protein